MAEPADRVTVRCVCGAKLLVSSSVVGRKVKCPKCGKVVSVQDPQDHRATDLTPELGRRHGEPISAETTQCVQCGATMAVDAILCVQCGYDSRLGRSRQPAVKPPPVRKQMPHRPPARSTAGSSEASAVGPYFAGVLFSCAGALLGAVVWAGIATAVGIELGWIAWGLGLAAGFGMLLGNRDGNSILSGTTAAVIALLGIVAAKMMILFFNVSWDEGIHLAGKLYVALSFAFTVDLFDVIFGLLAFFTAFKVGAGEFGED